MGRLPDFLLIGAQKCATTWLSAMLYKHPDVWLPLGGTRELHYFNGRILKVPLSWYSALFEHTDANGKIVGEKTPDYGILSHQIIALIRRLMPEVKIIIVLRRPDQRAWSQAKMDVNRLVRSLDASQINKIIMYTGTLFNVKRTDYLQILDRWFEYFPPEQILVGFMDEIKDSPNEFLKRVYDFIGVDPHSGPTEEEVKKHVRVGLKLSMPEAARWYLQRKYRPMILELSKRYPRQTEQWLHPDPNELKCSLLEKAKVLVLANVLTIPVNIAYLVFHSIKDLRMARRLREPEFKLSKNPEI
jgi:hypothetical protein